MSDVQTTEQQAAIEQQIVVTLVEIAQTAHKAAAMTGDARLKRIADASFAEISTSEGIVAMMDMVASTQAQLQDLQQGIQRDPHLEERERQQRETSQRCRDMLNETHQARLGNPQLVEQIQGLIQTLENQGGSGTSS